MPLGAQALPQDQQSVLLAQQQAVLEALTAALVRRTQLSAAAAAAATADARDLPEEMRMVRVRQYYFECFECLKYAA